MIKISAKDSHQRILLIVIQISNLYAQTSLFSNGSLFILKYNCIDQSKTRSKEKKSSVERKIEILTYFEQVVFQYTYIFFIFEFFQNYALA